MAELRIARRYAKSIFGLAEERKVTEQVFADMQLIVATCKTSPDLLALLRDPVVNTDKKDNILNLIFGDKTNVLTMTFIRIITRKGRELFLYEIAKEFVKLYKSAQGIFTAHLTSPFKMDKALRDQIISKVKLGIGESVEIVEHVDPSLIGGFILRMGDKQYDTSVAKKLKQLKQEFDTNYYEKAI